MTHHNGLVQAVVRQQVLGDLPFTEALQAGRIGLWRASLGYVTRVVLAAARKAENKGWGRLGRDLNSG